MCWRMALSWLLELLLLLRMPAECVSHVILAKGPPTISSSIDTRFRVQLRGTVALVCPIHADPTALIEWYRDGERVTDFWGRYQISDANYSLIIQHVECNDQGLYVCKAVNGFGVYQVNLHLEISDWQQEACLGSQEDDDGRRAAPNLIPTSVPVILDRSNKGKHLKPAGSHAVLKCVAVASPLPNITWFKDGVEISAYSNDQSKYTIRCSIEKTAPAEALLPSSSSVASSSPASRDHYETRRCTMQIAYLSASDTAKFTCRAYNSFGSAETNYFVEVVERQVPQRPELHPRFPDNGSIISGQSGSLVCKVKSEFPPDIHWLKQLHGQVHRHADDVIRADDDTASGGGGSATLLTPNRTLTFGNSWYQILPPVPAVAMSDGYYVSKLQFVLANFELHAGNYICLALNNAGYNYRQVYLNVTNQSVGDESSSISQGSLATKIQADSATTAVVCVFVILAVVTMVAACLMWKRRHGGGASGAKHALTAGLVVHKVMQSPAEQTSPPPLQQAACVAAPIHYSVFKDGLTCGAGRPDNNVIDPNPAAIVSGHSRPMTSAKHRHQQLDYLPERVVKSKHRRHHHYQQQQRRQTTPKTPTPLPSKQQRSVHRQLLSRVCERRDTSAAALSVPSIGVTGAASNHYSSTTRFNYSNDAVNYYSNNVRLARPSPETSFDTN